jgi:hypothetical protein
LCSLLTSHHGENLARSMGHQSTTFLTPRQGCFSTESANNGRSQPLEGCRNAAVGNLLCWSQRQSAEA